jgi:hypothetical protein
MISLPFAALPDLRAVPSPFWLLTVLHLLTFVLHLVAMASLVGGVLVVLADRSPDRWSRPAVRRLLALFPVLMAATVSLGVAPLLFLQLSYGKVAYAAAITSGTFWFLVPFLAMAAYACFYAASHRPAGDAGAGWRLVLGFAFLMAVSLVYSSTFSLAEHPDAYARLYKASASGLVLNPDIATWGPRWLQAVAGAAALGAFVTRLVARDDEALRTKSAGVLAVGAVAAAIAAGARFALDGAFGSALGTVGVATLAAGVLLPLVAAALVRGRVRGREAAAGSLLAVGLVASVVARHVARLGTLSGAFDPEAPAVRPQWDVFALFVVCLLAAVATMAWMLRVWFAKEAPRTE